MPRHIDRLERGAEGREHRLPRGAKTAQDERDRRRSSCRRRPDMPLSAGASDTRRNACTVQGHSLKVQEDTPGDAHEDTPGTRFPEHGRPSTLHGSCLRNP
ncbi:MAG TPA: hypothetical protein DEF41_15555 [Desulfovibrio sp.]|uniref:Uncharacterized protein n=1 Tax=Nitratidesulfovibrio vulgaris (strain ATCC 29579 / DSM 644 / CCUG 34227 / NCIMB 8303 / VKM B-1760 / Hildenborough) TaxID=882 RepID=Q727G0_NITV2|nr:hypothetical protein DVU_2895 [Nitratidesulfovibrio vulgaris str. Hildenborough]HBW17490.1 hypothetical protein [Desulfovibrio sp.]